MTTLTEPTYARIWEDGGATMMARVTNDSAGNVVRSDVTSIAYNVFDLSSTTPGTAVSSDSLTVASVVYNSLQTGGLWSKDSTGYNFKDTRPASIFSEPNHRYQIEYIFNPASGEDFPVVFQVLTRPIWSS